MTEYGFFGLLWESSLVIKVVFLVLIGMSVSTWSLIFYKWWELSRAGREVAAAGKAVDAAASLTDAVGACGQGAARVVADSGAQELERLRATGLATAEGGRLVLDSIRHALSDTAAAESDRLYGSLSYLSTCAAAAPLLGLFGTVWGIMSSFSSITGGAEGVAEVAPGLAEALGTTAAGLMVAIPAVLAYNLYLKMLTKVEGGLTSLSGSMLNQVKAELAEVVACAPKGEGS